MLSNHLPKDANILYSYLNTLLRDRYSSLEALCEDLDIDIEELRKQMYENGFVYEPVLNQFR